MEFQWNTVLFYRAGYCVYADFSFALVLSPEVLSILLSEFVILILRHQTHDWCKFTASISLVPNHNPNLILQPRTVEQQKFY